MTVRSDMPDAPVPEQGTPLFEADVPCPQCEYNLRGLTEPRCPECGEPFDPLEVLAWNKERTHRPLPFLWVVGKMLPHPIAFWSIPKVRRSNGLAVRHLLLVLAVSAAECGLCVGIQFGVAAVLPTMAFFILVGLATWDIHLLLCSLGLTLARTKRGFAEAYTLISYAGLWAIPAMAGLVADSVGTRPHHPPRIGLSMLGLAVTATFCLVWGIALYAGALRVTRGSHAAAIWCVVANPFWYIAGIALSASVGSP